MIGKAEIPNFKNDLFQVFKQTGLDQDLKAHMRARLLGKIKGTNQVKIEDLSKRVICSLFLDFLKKENFHYTPTVFVPECGSSDKILSASEIQQLLNLPDPGDLSVLEFILAKIKDIYFKKHCSESYTQTEDSPSTGLESRLQQLDSEFLSKTRGTPIENLEERMARYKRECDERMRFEINSEVLRIKEVEISAMRIEEASKYRMMLQKSRAEQEEYWKDQLEALKERERDQRDRIIMREKDLEVREHRQRQQFEKELEILKVKEGDLKRGVEIELEAARLQRRSWEQKKIELEGKLKEIENFKSNTETKAQEELNHHKRSFEAGFDEEKRKIYNEKFELQAMKDSVNLEFSKMRENEAKVKEQAGELVEVKRKLVYFKEENEKFVNELNRTREELRILSETSRRDLDLLSFKDQELAAVKNECSAYKEMYLEQKATLKKLESNQEKLVEKFAGEAMPGKYQIGESEYLAERKFAWKKLDKESLDLEKNMLEMITTSRLEQENLRSRQTYKSHYLPQQKFRTEVPYIRSERFKASEIKERASEDHEEEENYNEGVQEMVGKGPEKKVNSFSEDIYTHKATAPKEYKPSPKFAREASPKASPILETKPAPTEFKTAFEFSEESIKSQEDYESSQSSYTPQPISTQDLFSAAIKPQSKPEEPKPALIYSEESESDQGNLIQESIESSSKDDFF